MPDPRTIALVLLCLLLPIAAAADFGDPTRPALLPASTSPTDVVTEGPRLHGIWVTGNRRSAVIDGERVRVGDPVAGGRVISIELSGVRVRRSDGELELTLTGGGYKQPASPRRK